jgi:hypothetical protein
MSLTQQDIEQLNEIGINPDEISTQFQNLVYGPDVLNIQSACTVNNGIKQISEKQKKALIANFSGLMRSKKITRFTPASGAATRMFKHLINPEGNETLVSEFIDNITDFAFFEELDIRENEEDKAMINRLLSAEGLNYAKLPKALISFHKYQNEVRKAIDEQLIEGVKYVNNNGVSNFHFTISPEHEALVNSHLEKVVPTYEKELNTTFNISFSTQAKKSDTVSLSIENLIVRDENGQLVFRPGGHGALIHNLNDLDADVVIIKNIDNVVREEQQEVVVEYKKMLSSLLVNLQTTIFGIIEEISSSKVTKERLNKIVAFLKSDLNILVKPDCKLILSALNKPIRVCGMVKNEGKAGGGPFWVDDTPQIVESAQMDMSNPDVEKMINQATHFNPVDLVCGLKDYEGNKFDLLKYIDQKTFFVSSKSYNGNDIKVLEHPGLWNGAMANWITIFVEVPVSTFHPVKTVNDLLQIAHKNQ